MSQVDTSPLAAFARGDLDPLVFEEWFLDQTGLEALLGDELHWQLTSSDYRIEDTVWKLRQDLLVQVQLSTGCKCPLLRDLAVVPMGSDIDEKVFSTVETVQDHGGEQWWLFLARCTQCKQDWMVAQESRIYDDYLMRRLARSEVKAIERGDEWPPEFLSYEKVLGLEREHGTPPIWHDVNDSPVADTIQELRSENPDLSLEKAAHLVGITNAELIKLQF